MTKRSQSSQQEKHEIFNRAFDTVNAHLKNQNHIGAYVVAYSIFEDRITAAYLLLQDHLKNKRPTEIQKIKFYQKINLLHDNGFIPQAEKNALKACADERNRKIHAAMWNLNEFSAEDCKNVIKLARDADKLSRKLKKLT